MRESENDTNLEHVIFLYDRTKHLSHILPNLGPHLLTFDQFSSKSNFLIK